MRLIEVYHDDLLNGTGLREVLFFSGCEWHCPGCFNSFTWNPDADGQGHLWCEKDWIELEKNLKKPYISGVTLSGGDPLNKINEKGILGLCKRIRSIFGLSKTIWCYTGYTWENIQKFPIKKEILNYIDVLCDGPFIESKKSPDKLWVGSENQRVIDVRKSLENNKIVEYSNG